MLFFYPFSSQSFLIISANGPTQPSLLIKEYIAE